MSTAIVRIYTTEGFVVAADGRILQTDQASGASCVVTENAQKIFSIQKPGISLAYALTGALRPGQITDDGRNVVSYDLNEITRTAFDATPTTGGILDYVTIACRQIFGALEEAKTSGKITEYPTGGDGENAPGESGSTIARLLIDGYYGGWPARIGARFFHENQKICAPDIRHPDLYFGEPDLSGSAEIHHLLFKTNDPRFASYRVPVERSIKTTLAEAVAIADGYIRACCDPVALTADEKICRTIGGHIHIAKVTSQKGFEWVPGFEPRASEG